VKHPRIAIAGLALSAAGFVGLLVSESYVDTAMVPTKGDRWTVGFGSTFRDDGSAVQPGDKITPVQAVRRSFSHIAKDEAGVKRCVTGALNQSEYDILVDFAYQYGVNATCRSSMVRFINQGEYGKACEAYRLYKKSQGRDCSDPKHWGPGGCKGVWLRNQHRADKCQEAQK